MKKKLVKTYKGIEEAVVGGYQVLENGVVSGYKAIENTAVNFGRSLVEEYDCQKDEK